jgi:hypothetical protein
LLEPIEKGKIQLPDLEYQKQFGRVKHPPKPDKQSQTSASLGDSAKSKELDPKQLQPPILISTLTSTTDVASNKSVSESLTSSSSAADNASNTNLNSANIDSSIIYTKSAKSSSITSLNDEANNNTQQQGLAANISKEKSPSMEFENVQISARSIDIEQQTSTISTIDKAGRFKLLLFHFIIHIGSAQLQFSLIICINVL